MRSDADVGS